MRYGTIYHISFLFLFIPKYIQGMTHACDPTCKLKRIPLYTLTKQAKTSWHCCRWLSMLTTYCIYANIANKYESIYTDINY